MEAEGSLPSSQEPYTDPYPGQISPVSSISSYFYKKVFNIILPLIPSLPTGLFRSGFRTKILYVFLFSQCVLHSLPISSFFTWLG
jgi:hypothetical protein